MSEQGDEIKFLERAFTNVFDNEATEKELRVEFALAFLRAAKTGRSRLIKDLRVCTQANMGINIRPYFERIAALVIERMQKAYANKKKKVQEIGYVFGQLLAVIDTALSGDVLFRVHQEKGFPIDKKTKAEILSYVQNIKDELNQQEYAVEFRHIEKIVQRISRKHRKTMSSDQQDLLIRIAAIFAQ